MKQHSKHLSVCIVLMLLPVIGAGYYLFLSYEDRQDDFNEAGSEVFFQQVVRDADSEMIDRLSRPSTPISEELRVESTARLLGKTEFSDDKID